MIFLLKKFLLIILILMIISIIILIIIKLIEEDLACAKINKYSYFVFIFVIFLRMVNLSGY